MMKYPPSEMRRKEGVPSSSQTLPKFNNKMMKKFPNMVVLLSFATLFSLSSTRLPAFFTDSFSCVPHYPLVATSKITSNLGTKQSSKTIMYANLGQYINQRRAATKVVEEEEEEEEEEELEEEEDDYLTKLKNVFGVRREVAEVAEVLKEEEKEEEVVKVEELIEDEEDFGDKLRNMFSGRRGVTELKEEVVEEKKEEAKEEKEEKEEVAVEFAVAENNSTRNNLDKVNLNAIRELKADKVLASVNANVDEASAAAKASVEEVSIFVNTDEIASAIGGVFFGITLGTVLDIYLTATNLGRPFPLVDPLFPPFILAVLLSYWGYTSAGSDDVIQASIANSSLGNGARLVGGKAKDVISQVPDAASDAARIALAKAEKKAKAVPGRIGNAALDTAKGVTGAAVGAVGDATGAVVGAAFGAVAAVPGIVLVKVGKVAGKAVGGATQAVGGAVGGAVGKVVGKAVDNVVAVPGKIGSAAVDAAADAAGKALNKASQVPGKLAKGAADAATNAVVTAKDDAVNNVQTYTNNKVNDVVTARDNVLYKVTTFANDKVEKVTTFTNNRVDEVKALPGQVSDAANNAAEEAKIKVEEAKIKVTEDVKAFPDKVVKSAKDAVEKKS